jgi:insulysin
MTEAEFMTHRKALGVDLSEKHKSLYQRSTYFWAEIQECYYLFDRKSLQAQFLETVTKPDLVDFFRVFK